MNTLKMNLSEQEDVDMSVEDLDLDIPTISAKEANRALLRLLCLLDRVATPDRLPILGIIRAEAYKYASLLERP
jgi:hypothetical protein